MRIPISTSDLPEVETFLPPTPQQLVDIAHVDYLQARVRRLELAMIAAQMYCGQGDSRAAYGILAEALTSL